MSGYSVESARAAIGHWSAGVREGRARERADMLRWSWAPWTVTHAFLTGLSRSDEGRIGWAVETARLVSIGNAGHESLYHIEGRAAMFRAHDRGEKSMALAGARVQARVAPPRCATCCDAYGGCWACT